MKSWNELECTAHMIIDPYLDSNGKAYGRLEGSQYLFDLLQLLSQSRVLAETNSNLSYLTVLLYPQDHKRRLISIVPPGPMLNGSVEEFTVSLHQMVENGYEIVREERFAYQALSELVKWVETCFQAL